MKTTIRDLIIGYMEANPGWKNKGEIIGHIADLKDGYSCADGVGRRLRKMENDGLLAVSYPKGSSEYLLVARNAVEAKETSNLGLVRSDTKDFWADYDKRAESANDYIQRKSDEARKYEEPNLSLF